MTFGRPNEPTRKSNAPVEPWWREHKLAVLAIILALFATVIAGIFPYEVRRFFGLSPKPESTATATATISTQPPVPPTITLTTPERSVTGNSITGNEASSTNGQSDKWDRLFRGLIRAARQKPPDYTETIPPDGISTLLDVHSHARQIWAFDLSRKGEGYWFWGPTANDMVVTPCVVKFDGEWENCTPHTEVGNAPKTMRVHNLNRDKEMLLRLWFVDYAVDNSQTGRGNDDWKSAIPPSLLENH